MSREHTYIGSGFEATQSPPLHQIEAAPGTHSTPFEREESHTSKDLPKKIREDAIREQRWCYTCDERGHMTRKCPLRYIIKKKPPQGKACSQCGRGGHQASQCPDSCPNCFHFHPPGKCPTASVTCYLCEGNDHVPAKCPLEFLVDAVNKAHEKIAQDAIHDPRKTPTRASSPYRNPKRQKDSHPKEPTPPLETYHQLCLRSGRTLRRKKPCIIQQAPKPAYQPPRVPRPTFPKRPNNSNRANVVCFECGNKGHYARECPNPKETVQRPLKECSISMSKES